MPASSVLSVAQDCKFIDSEKSSQYLYGPTNGSQTASTQKF